MNIWIAVICTHNKAFASFKSLSAADTRCVYRYVQRFLLPAELIATYLFLDHRGINPAWVYQEEKQSSAMALPTLFPASTSQQVLVDGVHAYGWVAEQLDVSSC